MHRAPCGAPSHSRSAELEVYCSRDVREFMRSGRLFHYLACGL